MRVYNIFTKIRTYSRVVDRRPPPFGIYPHYPPVSSRTPNPNNESNTKTKKKNKKKSRHQRRWDFYFRRTEKSMSSRTGFDVSEVRNKPSRRREPIPKSISWDSAGSAAEETKRRCGEKGGHSVSSHACAGFFPSFFPVFFFHQFFFFFFSSTFPAQRDGTGIDSLTHTRISLSFSPHVPVAESSVVRWS